MFDTVIMEPFVYCFH